MTILSGLAESERQAQQRNAGLLQQAAQMQTLQQHFEQQAQERALRAALQESGGDVEKAAEIAVRTGNVMAAQKLAPLVEIQRKKKQEEQAAAAIGQINGLSNPQQSAAGPQMANIAPDIPTADPSHAQFAVPTSKPQPRGPNVEQRISNLQRLQQVYASQPAVVQRINSEIDRLRQNADKAPTQRTRISGETSIQEEYRDGQWAEIGRGPRFARQVQPVVNVNAASKEQLSPEAVRDLAIQSLYDPNATAGYRRDTTAMSRIANARMKVMKEAGITSEDVVSGRAGFKADTMSLNKITPQYDAITAFEKTAIRNGKILKELGDKVDATGVPVLERWIRSGRKVVAGDEDVAKFHAQMNLYRAEAARILTQPNLTGVLTDTARKEMEHVLQDSASAKQVREVVDLLERDFHNRRETLEEQIASIRARMRNRVAPGGGEQKPTAPGNPAPAPLPKPQKAIKDMTNAELMEYRRQLTGAGGGR